MTRDEAVHVAEATKRIAKIMAREIVVYDFKQARMYIEICNEMNSLLDYTLSRLEDQNG